MKIEFEISDKSFELLKAIKKNGQAEFRDSNYESLEEFKASLKEGATEEEIRRFKNRNFCDLKDIRDLISYDLIDMHEMAWHMTYVVTERGKEIIKKYSQE